MTFYSHQTRFAELIGSEKHEIIDTIAYYQKHQDSSLRIPSEDEISTITESPLTISWFNHLFSKKHWIDCPIAPDVLLRVNANAYADVTEYAATARATQRRARLFKLYGSSPHVRLFIPEQVINAMESYDWAQHQRDVETMLDARMRTIAGMNAEKSCIGQLVSNEPIH
jgi:hypothetical protein